MLVADRTSLRVILSAKESECVKPGTQRMDMTKENKSSLYLNARNCRATTDSDFCCDKVQQSILDFIVSKRITDVILASTWHGSYDITDEVFERQFREVVKRISSRSKRVWLVIDVPRGKL